MTIIFEDLDEKIIVITGGLGILGQAFSNALSEAGARVIIVDKNVKDFINGKQDYFVQHPSFQNTLLRECDVTNPNEVEELIHEVESRIGPIYGLVNNAATKTDSESKFYSDFESYSLATWKEIFEVNVHGSFLMAQAVGRAMRNRNEGSIVQISSIYGVIAPDPRIYQGSEYKGIPISSPAAYATTKAAVTGMVRYLAAYWGDVGIRINSISPGGVSSGQNGKFVENYSSRVPLGRMATTQDVVHALTFLLSRSSSYITGQNLIVDGGLSIW